MAEDKALETMRFELVPKMWVLYRYISYIYNWYFYCFDCCSITEENFWRNYFYRVSLIIQAAELGTLGADGVGQASSGEDGKCVVAGMSSEFSYHTVYQSSPYIKRGRGAAAAERPKLFIFLRLPLLYLYLCKLSSLLSLSISLNLSVSLSHTKHSRALNLNSILFNSLSKSKLSFYSFDFFDFLFTHTEKTHSPVRFLVFN